MLYKIEIVKILWAFVDPENSLATSSLGVK